MKTDDDEEGYLSSPVNSRPNQTVIISSSFSSSSSFHFIFFVGKGKKSSTQSCVRPISSSASASSIFFFRCWWSIVDFDSAGFNDSPVLRRQKTPAAFGGGIFFFFIRTLSTLWPVVSRRHQPPPKAAAAAEDGEIHNNNNTDDDLPRTASAESLSTEKKTMQWRCNDGASAIPVSLTRSRRSTRSGSSIGQQQRSIQPVRLPPKTVPTTAPTVIFCLHSGNFCWTQKTTLAWSDGPRGVGRGDGLPVVPSTRQLRPGHGNDDNNVIFC